MFALFVLLATLHLTAKDNGKNFTVQPHAPIVMTLLVNRGTDYRWKYEPSSGGGQVVKLVSRQFFWKHGRTGGGKEVWHLRAVGQGKMAMRFVPPGSPNPSENIKISIHVS